MNIGPAQIVPQGMHGPGAESRAKPVPATPALGKDSEAETNTLPSREPATYMGGEVVKVHVDTSSGSRILVYEFVDAQSGDLIFQIPSDQMLNLVQDIRQRLQRMAAHPGGEEK